MINETMHLNSVFGIFIYRYASLGNGREIVQIIEILVC